MTLPYSTPLTARELEVLQLLAAGLTNQAIAGELVVSLDTAKRHVSHVLGKLGGANRTAAISRARQLGLIPPRPVPRDTFVRVLAADWAALADIGIWRSCGSAL